MLTDMSTNTDENLMRILNYHFNKCKKTAVYLQIITTKNYRKQQNDEW